jgi:hypothetical protein
LVDLVLLGCGFPSFLGYLNLNWVDISYFLGYFWIFVYKI